MICPAPKIGLISQQTCIYNTPQLLKSPNKVLREALADRMLYFGDWHVLHVLICTRPTQEMHHCEPAEESVQ